MSDSLISGLLEAGNIDLKNRPLVKNADGSTSTVRSLSFEEDGNEILVPTVSPDGRILSDDDAISLYHETGQHLGKFRSVDDANAYAEQLHNDQAKFYKLDGEANAWGGWRFADVSALPKSASEGPESWGEAFGRLAAATDSTQRVINNVVSDDVARHDAYDGYIKEVYDATGVQMKNPLDIDLRQGAFDAKPNPQISGGSGLEWREQRLQASLDDFDRQREALAARYPAQARLIQLDIDGRVRKVMQDADREEKSAIQSPELGMAGRFTAQLLGGLKGSARDPYQWAMAVTGGASSAGGTVAARIGKTMLTEALLNGGQELVIEGANQQRLKDAGLEHGIGDMLRNAGIAATFGTLFGGTVQGGSELARVFKLGEGGAERATRILDGNPQPGDIEAIAPSLGIELTQDQVSQISRSFEERALDEHMIGASATPEQARVFEAAKRYAEDPDNFPEPELVERAIADEAPGATRSLTADEYEQLYAGGDPDVFDDIADTFAARDLDDAARFIDDVAGPRATLEEPPVPEGVVRVYHSGAAGEGETGRWVSTNRQYASDYRRDLPLYYMDVPETDPRVNSPDYPDQGVKQGFTFNFETSPAEAVHLREISREAPVVDAPEPDMGIRPDRALEPLDDAALIEAEQLAGEIRDPEIDANGNPRSLLDFVPLQDGDGNVRLVTPREALEAADEDGFFADLLEACKL